MSAVGAQHYFPLTENLLYFNLLCGLYGLMRKIKPTTAYLKLDSDKKLFTLMLVVTVIIILDSQIGYISDFIPETISSQGGISLFIGFAMIFIVTQFFILNYVKQLNRENKDRISHLHLLQTGVSVGQYILIAIIVIVVLQILFLQEYSIIDSLSH